jgi:hypothetical protein
MMLFIILFFDDLYLMSILLSIFYLRDILLRDLKVHLIVLLLIFIGIGRVEVILKDEVWWIFKLIVFDGG